MSECAGLTGFFFYIDASCKLPWMAKKNPGNCKVDGVWSYLPFFPACAGKKLLSQKPQDVIFMMLLASMAKC